MKNPWEKLLQILEEERVAIVSGNIEALLECLKQKERLLKDPELKSSPLSQETRQKIASLIKHNQQLLQAGLAFIEEAYRFLGSHLTPKMAYTPKGATKACPGGQLLNLEA